MTPENLGFSKKKKLHLEFEIVQMTFHFTNILAKLFIEKDIKHVNYRPNFTLLESPHEIYLEFYRYFLVLYLKSKNFPFTILQSYFESPYYLDLKYVI